MKQYNQKQLERIEKRIDNILDFSLYALKNPKILENFRSESHLALLPEGDVGLAKENIELAFDASKKDQKNVVCIVGKRFHKEYSDFDINSKRKPELIWK